MNGGWSKLPQLLPGGNYKTKIVFGGRGGRTTSDCSTDLARHSASWFQGPRKHPSH